MNKSRWEAAVLNSGPAKMEAAARRINCAARIAA
jgi:hypothetical protein